MLGAEEEPEEGHLPFQQPPKPKQLLPPHDVHALMGTHLAALDLMQQKSTKPQRKPSLPLLQDTTTASPSQDTSVHNNDGDTTESTTSIHDSSSVSYDSPYYEVNREIKATLAALKEQTAEKERIEATAPALDDTPRSPDDVGDAGEALLDPQADKSLPASPTPSTPTTLSLPNSPTVASPHDVSPRRGVAATSHPKLRPLPRPPSTLDDVTSKRPPTPPPKSPATELYSPPALFQRKPAPKPAEELSAPIDDSASESPASFPSSMKLPDEGSNDNRSLNEESFAPYATSSPILHHPQQEYDDGIFKILRTSSPLDQTIASLDSSADSVEGEEEETFGEALSYDDPSAFVPSPEAMTPEPMSPVADAIPQAHMATESTVPQQDQLVQLHEMEQQQQLQQQHQQQLQQLPQQQPLQQRPVQQQQKERIQLPQAPPQRHRPEVQQQQQEAQMTPPERPSPPKQRPSIDHSHLRAHNNRRSNSLPKPEIGVDPSTFPAPSLSSTDLHRLAQPSRASSARSFSTRTSRSSSASSLPRSSNSPQRRKMSMPVQHHSPQLNASNRSSPFQPGRMEYHRASLPTINTTGVANGRAPSNHSSSESYTSVSAAPPPVAVNAHGLPFYPPSSSSPPSPPIPFQPLSQAHLKPGDNASLLRSKQTLKMYRLQAKKMANDLEIQFEFAAFLVNIGETVGNEEDNLVDEGCRILKKLSQQGHAEAQYFLATCYINGVNCPKVDWDKAFPLLQQASKHNHPQAAYLLARCYASGQGVRREGSRALQWYKKSAASAHPGAMYALGMAFITGNLNAAPAASSSSSSSYGSSSSSSSASSNFTPMSVRRSPKDGVKWLKRACDIATPEYADPLFELAQLHETGIENVIFRDPAYAISLYTRAAEMSHVRSMYRLGESYEFGKLGCDVDPWRSVGWYRAAAEQGHADSCFAMTAWYLVGHPGVLPRSDVDAFRWAVRAAERGHPKATYASAYFLEIGMGVDADPVGAMTWYKKAAELGDPRAVARLESGLAANDGPTSSNSRSREGNDLARHRTPDPSLQNNNNNINNNNNSNGKINNSIHNPNIINGVHTVSSQSSDAVDPASLAFDASGPAGGAPYPTFGRTYQTATAPTTLPFPASPTSVPSSPRDFGAARKKEGDCTIM